MNKKMQMRKFICIMMAALLLMFSFNGHVFAEQTQRNFIIDDDFRDIPLGIAVSDALQVLL